jgi:tetratricopeptide (TPR) repeat protein
MLTGQVFVSHTSDMARFPGGRSFVQAALDAVNRAGMAAVDMRYFAARDGKPADYCRERVRECEVYVAVVGFRYGSMVPGDSVSYTELEFDEASTAGLPRLVFLLDDTASLPAALADADLVSVKGFRQRLRDGGLIVAGFTSAADLELEVFHALTDMAGRVRPPAPGTLPPGLAVRYSLPPDTAAFTGRDDEMGRIASAVTDAASSGGVVAIHAIGGMPGVGKTALAVHVARRLRDRFGDRQLFIDLHAHTPGQDPVAPEAALAGLLSAVGVDPRYLPADLDGRAGLWRDKMAGARAVLVLDNAASSTQVTPLLPGGDGCLVLVTSRRHLGDLPGAVVPVVLDALPPDQAVQMFLALAPRAAADPQAVRELVRLAGYLPLAISLLARVYARHPAWTLEDLTRDTAASLLTMAAEKDSTAAAFDVSYRHLPAGQQQFFRRLGLHPATTTDAYASAALTGLPLPDAARLLDALHGEGLLTETGYRRYGMHDLIRRYARNLAATDPAADNGQALELLLDYYQHAAATAGTLVSRQSRTAPAILPAPPAAVPDLADSARALAWTRAERASLLACLDHVTRTGQHDRVLALTTAIAALLRLDGPWTDAVTRHTTAAQTAQSLDDQAGNAGALTQLGVARRLTGDYPGAAGALEEALGIYRDLGDRLGRAGALTHLGAVRYQTGDYPGATEVLEEALGIYRDLGDRLGQADALKDLGVVRYVTADYPGAAQVLQEALGISRDLGDRLGQAGALSNLGAVRYVTGDYPGAAQVLEEALGICRDLGSRLGQANALSYLGSVQHKTGDYPSAAGVLDEALGIYLDLGDLVGQANTLTDLGGVRRLTGDYPGAAQALEEALGICRDLGDRLGQANALSHLAAVRRLTGNYPGAAKALEEALGIYRDIGDRQGETEALNEAGALNLVGGDLDEARECHRQALELAREIGSSPDEARALGGLGRCALAAGRTAAAQASLRQALEIFQRIGAAEAADVAAELGTLTATAPASPDGG